MRLAGRRVLTICVDTAATIVDLHMVTRAGLQPRQLLKSLLKVPAQNEAKCSERAASIRQAKIARSPLKRLLKISVYTQWGSKVCAHQVKNVY